ncbi:MAG: hypothetical protein C5B50_19105 [Verrucomicrobia bacterium]|nr:MAG: hypothetical protein C5B50_19105 [Verrucomicrobiota bacterium]
MSAALTPGEIQRQVRPRVGHVRKEVAGGSKILPEAAWSAVAGSLRLSLRELGIARGVFDGRTEPQIASDFGISTHTVHTHIQRLRRKLRVTDRVSLVLMIMREFLRMTATTGTGLPPICAFRTAGLCQRCD